MTASSMRERAAKLAVALRRSIQTASNDDYSEPMTEKRYRHAARLDAMSDAAELLEALALPDDPPQGDREVRIAISRRMAEQAREIDNTGDFVYSIDELAAMFGARLAVAEAGALATARAEGAGAPCAYCGSREPGHLLPGGFCPEECTPAGRSALEEPT